jgi:hypothetical protein
LTSVKYISAGNELMIQYSDGLLAIDSQQANGL